MNLTRTPTSMRARMLPWAVLVLAALGAYELIGMRAAAPPSNQTQAVAAVPTAAAAPTHAVDPSRSIRATGLSAEAEDAAKRAALPADEIPTF